MTQMKTFRTGPVALAAGTYTTDILHPGTRSLATAGAERVAVGVTPLGDPYVLIKQVRIVNTTAGPLTYRLHKTTIGGAAAAANAVFGYDESVPAISTVVKTGNLRLDGSVAADYLVGGGSAGGLTIELEGEIGIA